MCFATWDCGRAYPRRLSLAVSRLFGGFESGGPLRERSEYLKAGEVGMSQRSNSKAPEAGMAGSGVSNTQAAPSLSRHWRRRTPGPTTAVKSGSLTMIC